MSQGSAQTDESLVWHSASGTFTGNSKPYFYLYQCNLVYLQQLHEEVLNME